MSPRMANFDRILVTVVPIPNRSARYATRAKEKSSERAFASFIVQTMARHFIDIHSAWCAQCAPNESHFFFLSSLRRPRDFWQKLLHSDLRGILCCEFRIPRIELFISESHSTLIVTVFFSSRHWSLVHWVWIRRKTLTKNGTQCELVTRRRQLIYTNLHCFWCFWLYHKLHGHCSK